MRNIFRKKKAPTLGEILEPIFQRAMERREALDEALNKYSEIMTWVFHEEEEVFPLEEIEDIPGED